MEVMERRGAARKVVALFERGRRRAAARNTEEAMLPEDAGGGPDASTAQSIIEDSPATVLC